MTQYREILRLHSLGLSNREIATSLNVSRNTVSMVLIKTGELHLFWPLESTITDSVIERKLYLKKEKSKDARSGKTGQRARLKRDKDSAINGTATAVHRDRSFS